jgi:cytochrome P450
MPHSFLFGHLPAIAAVAIENKMPRDAVGQCVPLLLAKRYPEAMKAGCIYMDVWPISQPTLAVFHPQMMAQFTQDRNMPKHPNMQAEFTPFTGATDLACSEGNEWKTSRAIFNPGFSARNLLSLVPAFVEEAVVFREYMRKFAKGGDVVRLETATTNLTVDIIGRAVLYVRCSTLNFHMYAWDANNATGARVCMRKTGP